MLSQMELGFKSLSFLCVNSFLFVIDHFRAANAAAAASSSFCGINIDVKQRAEVKAKALTCQIWEAFPL